MFSRLTSSPIKFKYRLLVFVWLVFTAWWLFIESMNFVKNEQNYFFGATYGIMAVIGGVWGVIASRLWGSKKSALGKGLIYLSTGLFAQEFGQLIFSYYNIVLKREVPYPSLADWGFFGSIVLYLIALYYLMRVAGASLQLRTFSAKFQVLTIPLTVLVSTYYLFLNQYEFDWSQPWLIFLDFGYPLGQSLYLSVALIIFSLSRRILGGIMRLAILLIIVALSVQYIADINFLYQHINDSWINGRYGDYLYFIAYVFMTIAVLEFENAYYSLRNKK